MCQMVSILNTARDVSVGRQSETRIWKTSNTGYRLLCSCVRNIGQTRNPHRKTPDLTMLRGFSADLSNSLLPTSLTKVPLFILRRLSAWYLGPISDPALAEIFRKKEDLVLLLRFKSNLKGNQFASFIFKAGKYQPLFSSTQH